jgi:hypothetical protein
MPGVRPCSGDTCRRRVSGYPHVPILAALLLFLPSCGSGDLPLEAVDPDAAPLRPTYEQAAAVLDHYCVPCHGGAPQPTPAGAARPAGAREEGEGGDYSTCAGIQQGLPGIVSTVLFKGSMPPGALPRVPEREKLLLRRWIEQGACSPCTGGCP